MNVWKIVSLISSAVAFGVSIINSCVQSKAQNVMMQQQVTKIVEEVLKNK